MTADIIILADRRLAAASPRRDAAAEPGTIILLPPKAMRAAALAARGRASNAAASAAPLEAAFRHLLDIGRHSDAIRGRMDALQKSASAFAETSDTIIDALRGGVRVKHGFAQEARNA